MPFDLTAILADIPVFVDGIVLGLGVSFLLSGLFKFAIIALLTFTFIVGFNYIPTALNITWLTIYGYFHGLGWI